MIAFILRRHQTFMLVSPFCDSHPILCRACRVAILHAEMNPAKASQVPLGLLHTALEAQGLEKDNGECTGEQLPSLIAYSPRRLRCRFLKDLPGTYASACFICA